jgi:4'-phosphopantetheinyl transferase EntD
MADFAEKLRRVLPPAVALGQANVGESHQDFEGEDVPKATPRRLAEFRCGRRAARRAMAQLGVGQMAVPMGVDRAPIWPTGLVGSISHCEGLCLALVASATEVRALGLDVEPLRDLPREVWETILCPEELADLHDLEAGLRGRSALRYFVAKEAVYKAQYPISKRLFDFQTVRISSQSQSFSAEFLQDVPEFPRGTVITGTFVEEADFLAAVVVLT